MTRAGGPTGPRSRAAGTIVVRADASAAIGTGHVLRCLALAQAWEERGGRAVFATAMTEGDAPGIDARVRSEGFDVVRVAATRGSAEDGAATRAIAARENARWVVADGYAFGAAFQRELRGIGDPRDLRVALVDDVGDLGAYDAELVVNQNPHAAAAMYAGARGDAELLLGPTYALLRREFRDRGRAARDARTIPEVARRLLVTLGGSDPPGATLAVVRALGALGARGASETPAIDALVVCGPANPRAAEVEAAAAAARDGARVTVVRSVDDMPARMAEADLAVTAAGSTCWELAFCGLPAILVTVAENQRDIGPRLAALGVARHAGWANELDGAALARSIADLAASRADRAAMSERGRALVDGDGAARVVRALAGDPAHLRRAVAADVEPVWRWMNDPLARAVSFDSAPIAWETHETWFRRALADPSMTLHVAVGADDAPVGEVRYARSGDEAVVSIVLAPSARGKGLGTFVLEQSARLLFRGRDFQRIRARIKATNAASIRAFEKAGYGATKTIEVGGAAAVELVLHRPEAR